MIELTDSRYDRAFSIVIDPINALKRLSEQCSVREAFAELIDNVFDNFARKRSEHKRNSLDVSIYFISVSGDGFDEIILTENSGGAKADELIPLVRLGDSVTTGAPTIGAWGQGSKIACFALSDEIEIFTSYPDETPICIHFPNGWLVDGSSFIADWEVRRYRAENVPEGSTIFRFTNLKNRAKTAKIDEIAIYLQKIYSVKLESFIEQGLEVSINLENIGTDERYTLEPTFTLDKIEQDHGFCMFPDYSPVKITRTLTSQGSDDEEVKIV